MVMSPGPRALTVDAVVQISSAYWLRIPIGKLHNDRYLSLHPHLKERRVAPLRRRGGARAPGRREGGPAAGRHRGRTGSLGDVTVQPGDAVVVSWVHGVEVRRAPAEAEMLGLFSAYFRPRVSSMPTNRPTPVAMRRAVIGCLRAYSTMS